MGGRVCLVVQRVDERRDKREEALQKAYASHVCIACRFQCERVKARVDCIKDLSDSPFNPLLSACS